MRKRKHSANLGPILFNIYINDLFSLPLKAKVTGFADDTSLVYTAATARDINSALQHDQYLLVPWFKKHLLHLNVDKCNGIVYSYKKVWWSNDVRLQIDNKELKIVDKIKYLFGTYFRRQIHMERAHFGFAGKTSETKISFLAFEKTI